MKAGNLKISVAALLRYLIALTFIFSAVSKLMPIEVFELLIVNQGIAGWDLAPFLSRVIISIELFIGISFFQKYLLKRFFVPAAFIILLVFSIHLVFTLIAYPQMTNCGCFGEVLPMTPLESLIKNILMMAVLFFIFKVTPSEKKIEWGYPLTEFLVIGMIIFLMFPLKEYSKYEDGLNVPRSYEITSGGDPSSERSNNLSEFTPFTQFSDGVSVDLNRGDKIVALFSLDCDHCLDACREFTELSEETDTPPMYILFLGEEERTEWFFDEAGSSYPYKILQPQEFFPLIKTSTPRIVYLSNGSNIAEWNYEEFEIGEVRETILEQYE